MDFYKATNISALFLMVFFLMPSQVYAQEDGLADFSIELPPQPAPVAGPAKLEPVTAVETPVSDSVKTDTVPNSASKSAEIKVIEPEMKLETMVDEPVDALEPVVPVSAAVTEPELKPIPHSGTYYDATSLSGGVGGNSLRAPRQVDPRYEPGSSFVVVQKAASANSQAAKIVAAQRALSLGRYAAALELYEQLYSKKPRDVQILMGLAVAQQQNGFTESAIATYEELLSIDPDNADATANMLGLLKTQYPAVAYRRLKDMWDSNNGSAYVAAELGLINASMQNNEEAIRYLGIAASMEPNNAQHYYNMAVIYDRASQPREALELYEKALAVDLAYGGGRTFNRAEIYDRLAQLRRL